MSDCKHEFSFSRDCYPPLLNCADCGLAMDDYTRAAEGRQATALVGPAPGTPIAGFIDADIRGNPVFTVITANCPPEWRYIFDGSAVTLEDGRTMPGWLVLP